jgi:hypothetical protein
MEHDHLHLSGGLSGCDLASHKSGGTGYLVMSQDGRAASGSAVSIISESPSHRIMENHAKAQNDFAPKQGTHGEVQLIEQFEPGVYVTLIQLKDGTKVFKRVRFRYLPLFNGVNNLNSKLLLKKGCPVHVAPACVGSGKGPTTYYLSTKIYNLCELICSDSKRRFAENQAEEWWRENQERVFKKYSHPTHQVSHASSQDEEHHL